MSIMEVFLYLFIPVSAVIFVWCVVFIQERSRPSIKVDAADASNIVGRENDLRSDVTWWIIPLVVVVIVGGAGIWLSRRNS